MIETLKEFTFEAAHQLPPFSGLHGHSFLVQVFLRGEPDPVYGWSHNLYEVEKVVEKVRLKVDHTYLNDIEGLEHPSLENVARWIWNQLAGDLDGLDRVMVRRGPDGLAEGCTYSGRPISEKQGAGEIYNLGG
ncbi:6-pyruvoyl trahydropterin synthase family protein [Roseomonas gilardii]|uniref:6-pyruvoyl trahydropterin synthase family protein n=1 Tax=Roseomonas gilardii TaxID=257708 RepID=UPI000483A1B6|nr:6-carboxytetrahydropterin synthase [Roseomonas gilardii]SUE44995.1 6-carboxy-5,6,7,8-tetrahydropterin synthase [Roseomonas gilardii subsp. rosea]